MITEYLFTAAVVIIGCYLVATCVHFEQVPKSISYTHYLWTNECKGGSLIFPFVMVSVTFLLCPHWIIVTPMRWQFIAFIGAAALAFVGCAAFYEGTLTKSVHYTAAIIWAVCSVVWIILFNQGFALLYSVCICFFLGIFSGKKKITFWAETACIMALIIAISLYCNGY